MLALSKSGRVSIALAASFCALIFAGDAAAQERPRPIGTLYAGVPSEDPLTPPAPPEPCMEDCFLLASLGLRGSVSEQMSFELKGTIRDKQGEAIKVPLFGPPDQVRLDDVTVNGAPAQVSFDGERYYVYTSARAFTVRGKLKVGSDQLLSVAGPVVAVDAKLSSGRLVEGDSLSGVSGAVLHFDPMTDGESKPKAPPVFRLARALRFGRETSFVYRVTAQEDGDIGSLRLPLRYGEKVGDVQGSSGWTVEGTELVLPVAGKEAEITIAGTMPGVVGGAKTFQPDGRSAYEWWLVEADPDHRFDAAGEPKMVETSQSPIPPQFPGARVFLVQKGQSLEVDARSLVRGDVLAAVARKHRRFVAITGRGELISDETIEYDNNGLDHLMVTPAGKAMYLSTDHVAQRILHTEAGARAMLVPVRSGGHELRVQSLDEASLWPIAGAVKIPSTRFPLTTGQSEMTIGLPEHVRPLAVFGGDRTRWGFARGDLVAIAVGVALACFGFRTRKTRAIASLCTAGLWFVSKEAFVVATAALFFAGAVFLASRFLRSTWLMVASGLFAVLALLGGRFALESDATSDPQYEMLVGRSDLPRPETAGARDVIAHGDPRADITPVSISFPTSERYVFASRQLVSNERPFEPRVVYVTTSFVGFLHAAWLVLVGLLVWAHKDRLAALKAKIAERLTRRPTPPDPTTAPEAPPF
ncbi:MAG: hypothetical protein KIT84_39275 [Labilithrix sp.]|nr:hypothetical protein [Labilithrix sp.]MCW5817104.1 hypothetical protein [Labilithrix sp.]